MEIHAELGRSELENVHGQGDASKKKVECLKLNIITVNV